MAAYYRSQADGWLQMNASSEFWSLFDNKSPVVVYGHPGTGRSTFLMSFAVHCVTNCDQERIALVDCASRLPINRLKQIAKEAAILKRILIFQPCSSWEFLEIIDDLNLLSKPQPQILIDSPFWNTQPEDHMYLSYVFSKLRECFDSATNSSATLIAVNAHRPSKGPVGLVPQHRAILGRYFENWVLLEKTRGMHKATVKLDNKEKLHVELWMTKTGLSTTDPRDPEN
jgi:hypothetical protein